jgi:hypothetical protein
VLEDGSQQMLPYDNSHFKDRVKFFNTGVTIQNSLSVAGQDFYLSVQDAKIKGLVPDDENRRTSFRFNGSKTMGKFSVNYGLNYILQNFNVVDESGFQTEFPGAYDGGIFLLVEQTASNVPLLSYKDLNSKFGQYSNYYNEYAINPYWVIGNLRTTGRSDDILGNVDLNYQLFPWLKATTRVSSSLHFGNQQNNDAPVIVSDWAAANRNAVQYSNKPGNVFTNENYTSRLNFDYYLSGEHSIKSDLSVNYLLGGALQDNRAKDVSGALSI